MTNVLPLLLKMVCLYDGSSALELLPIETLVDHLLGSQPSSLPLLNGDSDSDGLAGVLQAVAVAAMQIQEVGTPGLQEIKRAAHTLGLLNVLQKVGIGGLDKIDLHGEELAVLHLVRTLEIDVDDSAPQITLVGGNHQLGPEVTIKPFKHGPLADKIDITYTNNSLFPRLTVRAPAERAFSERRDERYNWPQRPAPEQDLHIFTYNDRNVGRISTRRFSLPHVIEGQHYRLLFTPDTPLQLLATSVHEPSGILVAQVIRVSAPVQ